MNEGEKEAIEKLDYELTYSWVHNQGISKETLKLFKDIIEKQQKEIERLKQIEDWKNYRVYKNVEDYEIHDKFGKNNLLTKCIHKDKIKEKMRGEINKSWRNTEQRKCQLYAYEILKELLGE